MACQEVVETTPPWVVTGRLTRVTGLVMEAVGLKLAVGSSCIVSLPDGHNVEAEVVGFAGERLLLMPSTDVYGLTPGAKVTPVLGSVLPVPGRVWVRALFRTAVPRIVPNMSLWGTSCWVG